MPLKNYTSGMDADRSIAQIQKLLARAGATKVMTDYEDGILSAISFALNINGQTIGFRLPCDWRKVHAVLTKDKKSFSTSNRRYARQQSEWRLQAVRTAWKIVLDWVDAQLAIIETDMVRTEQVFLPYMVVKGGETLYEQIANDQFLLGDGK